MPSARRPARVPSTAPPQVTGANGVPAQLPTFAVGDVLAGGVSAATLTSERITAALYGKNGTGKTTLACQGEGPIVLIAIEPAPTGGARSIGRADVAVYQVAAGFLQGRDGQSERVRGSAKVLAIADSLARAFAAGQCPFRKVVIDGVTSWSEIILGEILGIDWTDMPGILSLGKVSGDQYTERGERFIRYLRPFLTLPCDLWILAQEKDHNPPMSKTTTKSGKEYERPRQSRLMQDAHPIEDHEGSFFSLAVGDAPDKFIQDSCDFVMQLYEANEWREERAPDVNMNGTIVPGLVQVVPTGRRVRRLRCTYDGRHAARFRAPDWRNVPEYIEAPSPEERYQAFLDVVAGRRTNYGYYPERK
jgi:hypothetical protein